MRKPHDHWLRDVNHPRIFSLEDYEIGDAFFTKYNEETLIGFGTAVVRKLHLAAKSLQGQPLRREPQGDGGFHPAALQDAAGSYGQLSAAACPGQESAHL